MPPLASQWPAPLAKAARLRAEGGRGRRIKIRKARVATFARRLAKAREARENKNQNKGNRSTPEQRINILLVIISIIVPYGASFYLPLAILKDSTGMILKNNAMAERIESAIKIRLLRKIKITVSRTIS
jgi:hypothetical protein